MVVICLKTIGFDIMVLLIFHLVPGSTNSSDRPRSFKEPSETGNHLSVTKWSADPGLSRDITSEYKLMINGPEAGVDMYFDKVEVSNYSRDRTWKAASDLRIEELRKTDVTFKEWAD